MGGLPGLPDDTNGGCGVVHFWRCHDGWDGEIDLFQDVNATIELFNLDGHRGPSSSHELARVIDGSSTSSALLRMMA